MAEPHVPGCCRCSWVIIDLLQNKRGERQGTSPLRPEKENKKRSAETLETRSFPSLIQGASGRIGCYAATRRSSHAGARSWETALLCLFAGALPCCPVSRPTWSISAFFLTLPSKRLFLPLATETLPLYRLLYGTVSYYTAFSKTQLNHSPRNQTAAYGKSLT